MHPRHLCCWHLRLQTYNLLFLLSPRFATTGFRQGILEFVTLVSQATAAEARRQIAMLFEGTTFGFDGFGT